MKKFSRLTIIALTAMIFLCSVKAQNVGIGTITPNESAILEIKSSNKGLLVPQVSLTSLTDVATIPMPATGLLVYNTNAALPGGAGFYYNSGTTAPAAWLKLQTGSGSGSGWSLTGNTGTDTSINFLGTINSMPLRIKVFNNWAGQISRRNVFLGLNAGMDDNESIVAGSSNGSYNVGLGNRALRFTTTGHNNVAIGSAALFNSTIDNSTVAVGDSSLFFNDDLSGIGNVNTGVGSHSMFSTGFTGTNAYYNTAVGGFSLFNNDIGHGNTAIGVNADVSDPGLFNSTVIGWNAVVDSSNKVRIGDDNIISIGGKVGWSTFSDGRYKKDVQEDVKGLNFIMQLRPVTYHYDTQKLNEECAARYAKLNKIYLLKNPDNTENGKNPAGGFSFMKYKPVVNADEKRYSGFIAQEVEAAAKNVGYDFSGIDKPGSAKGKYALRYAEFVVPLIKAVQEQQLIIEAQNKKIDDLVKRLEKLEQKN